MHWGIAILLPEPRLSLSSEQIEEVGLQMPGRLSMR